MERSCELDGNYRYLLRIQISEGGKCALFVLCNPSTADHMDDDPTTRNLKKWAGQNGVGMIIIANLYAYRASRPAALLSLSESEAIGGKNMDAITRAAMEVDEVIVGWGNPPPKSRSKKEFVKQGQEVLAALSQRHKNVYCMGKTKFGHPRHPRVWYMTRNHEKIFYP